MSYPWADLLLNAACSAVAIVLLFGAVMAISSRVKNHSIIDVFWGPSFVLVAVVSYVLSDGTGGHDLRRLLVLALTSIWGLRLGIYLARRNRGKGEDPRYSALLKHNRGSQTVFLVRHIYGLQATFVWVISLPVQFAMYVSRGFDVVMAMGVALWAVGFCFETIGDWQLDRFRREHLNRGKIMDRGLWSWTRHPNYFGDVCVWVGLFVLTLGSPWGILTVVSPILMARLLLVYSGKALLEKRMRRSRGEAYEEYCARTSGFFPLPPKRSSGQR